MTGYRDNYINISRPESSVEHLKNVLRRHSQMLLLAVVGALLLQFIGVGPAGKGALSLVIVSKALFVIMNEPTYKRTHTS